MTERRPVKEVCGCVHNGQRWISECPACRAEHAEMHRQADEDYRARNSVLPPDGVRDAPCP